MTLTEIYNLLGNMLQNSIKEPYKSATLGVTRVPDGVALTGSYTGKNGAFVSGIVIQPDRAVVGAVQELYRQTVSPGENWDSFQMFINSEGEFVIEFNWDESPGPPLS